MDPFRIDKLIKFLFSSYKEIFLSERTALEKLQSRSSETAGFYHTGIRGYWGIGVERISKPFNVGNLFRSAHAFGASFVFTIAAAYKRDVGGKTDTSDSVAHVPFYTFPTVEELVLPEGCELVGVELTAEACDLPSFRHPHRAAYVLGPERGSLSPEMMAHCKHIIRIPTKFCLNVGIAGVVVMYDRLVSMGRFPPRPVVPGGESVDRQNHVRGGPVLRATDMDKYRTAPPLAEIATAAADNKR